MLQWRVLARRVDGARRWVPASIAGWATGAALSSAASHIDEGLDILIGPVVAAAISGVVLVALIGGTTAGEGAHDDRLDGRLRTARP
jgi:hypothetical protein